jgi:hypothetical protein
MKSCENCEYCDVIEEVCENPYTEECVVVLNYSCEQHCEAE